MKKFIYVGMSLALMGAIGCAQNKPPKPIDPLVLVQSDLEGLESFNASGAESYDLVANNRFGQIFGGSSGKNVRAFIDERIKHYIRNSDIGSITPSIHLGWTHQPEPANKKAVVGASNLGIQYWLQGLADGTDVEILLYNGQRIAVDSSRSGIMLFGPGYKKVATSRDNSIELPQSYRQAILVHEARHSDCNDGISADDVNTIKQARSYSEFFDSFRAKKCGHLHSLCASGDYKDLPACDKHSWGSYAVGLVFLEAALKNATRGSAEWQILNTTVIDMKTRLEYDHSTMIHSRTDHPDLTSSGLRSTSR